MPALSRDCKRISELISDYVDGTVSPADERLVSEHIAACEDCKRAVARTRMLVSQLGGLKAEVPFDLWSGVSRRISEKQDQKSTRGRLLGLSGWKAVAIPLAAAAAAALIFTVRVPESTVPTQGNKPASPQQQVTQAAPVSSEYNAYLQAYSRFRASQSLSDRAAINAAARLQRQEQEAVPR